MGDSSVVWMSMTFGRDENDIAFTNIRELRGQADELMERIISELRNNPQDSEVQELRNQRRQLWDKIERLKNDYQVGSSGAVEGFSSQFGSEVFSAKNYQINREFLDQITCINQNKLGHPRFRGVQHQRQGN
jgi:hypothetical protein